MEKKEFLERVQQQLGEGAPSLTKLDTVVNATFHTIAAAMAENEKVSIFGFGSFSAKYQNPRTGRNPQTKEPIPVPGRFKPVFKPSSLLKEQVAAIEKK